MSVERILWDQDATGLADLVRKGELSPVELTDAAIARAEATRPEINATAEPLYEAARARARTMDRSLPLAGVPFAVKDLGIAIKGVPVHGGSRIPAWVPDVSSVLAERYLAAGLIPIATSTSPEHGLRLMTESKAFGVTRNPCRRRRRAGGARLRWRRFHPRSVRLQRACRPEDLARPRSAVAPGQRRLVWHGGRSRRHPLGA